MQAKWVCALLTLGIGATAVGLPPYPPPTLAGTVVRVLDAVTLEVRLTRLPTPAPAGLVVGTVVPVRYLGLGTSEASREAASLSALLVGGREVYLELDGQERDGQGNLLAYVYLDPEGRLMVNVALLTTGLFTASPSPGLRYAAALAHAAAMPAPSPGCPSPVPWAEARGQIGKTLCVEGPVASVGTSAGGDVFLNLGRAYPDPGRFTLYIPARHVGKFEAAFGTRFWTRLVGKTVQATGEIRLYQGVPEIQLGDPSALFVKP
ncbi:MAG: hypothetical protein N2320_06395 [Candidatus Bipolaricaulota bacterium]|nr:hypothetical protein [Candidatus Bipolaricaulota bacterium]